MKDIRLLLAFALLCFTGIAGISAWPKFETTLGYFKISKNPFGVAIYQEGLHKSVQFTNALSYTIQNQTVFITAKKPILINYSRDDILFDKNGTIYTEPTQEQIDLLSRLLQKSLTKSKTLERIIQFPSGEIYLVNPSIPGMLKIQSALSMPINLDTKIITSNGPLSVVVFDSITL